MRTELIVNTKSLGGTSDLTLLAPIRKGLVPSLESVTYKTRVKRLLKALNVGRSSSHEYALLRPFSDAVERVGRIHSVRVAVLEPENKVLLAATFDGAWESYIRVLWQKVGSLLDVIFCNTEEYDCACENTFDVWLAWARRVQVETHFFYSVPEVSVADVRYLRSAEALIRKVPPATDFQGEAARLLAGSAEDDAWDAATGSGLQVEETVRQGLQALAFLYRLTDLYVPLDNGKDDGRFLRRAAQELLREFVLLGKNAIVKAVLDSDAVKKRFGRQLEWLFAEPTGGAVRRLPPALPALGKVPAVVATDIQGGMLKGYENVTHGCLMLLSFADTTAAKRYVARAAGILTTHEQEHELAVGKMVINMALTCEGLRALGVTEDQLAYFSQEFREGMEARASVLGDYRFNHPRRWRLPEQFGAGRKRRVELSAVHVVVQLRGNDAAADVDALVDTFQKMMAPATATLLSVEPMIRHYDEHRKVQEHFGFVDGDSQPQLEAVGTRYPNQIHLGEVLLGYENEADPVPRPLHGEAAERLEWLRNGSYLVVRKLRQDVRALYAAVETVAPVAGTDSSARDGVLALMMGRKLGGDPLALSGAKNDFDYSGDPDGSKCPFASHVRRANPRAAATPTEPPGRRTPRLVRRGMSYGARYDHSRSEKDKANTGERGLFFMTYNASISEQFEVVQRWLSGGNSTGISSDQSDPFLGVAKNGTRRSFRFGNGPSQTIALDGGDLLSDPKPFVRLEWGSYLFTPSIALLKKLGTMAKSVEPVETVWSAARGVSLFPGATSALSRSSEKPDPADAWKELLEDPNAIDEFVSASVLAAVRRHHDGVLQTPYGVLVADRDVLMDVLLDPKRNYTVEGYHERMEGTDSIGEIYLGLDRPVDGGEYDAQSRLTNEAIGEIGERDSFILARRLAKDALDSFLEVAAKTPLPSDASRWDLNLDATEVTDLVLEGLCQYWFGLPKLDAGPATPPIVPGRFRWDWKDSDPPTYPGHFTAPSRYLFQPHPNDLVESFGRRYGAALTRAMKRFLAPHIEAKTVPKTPGTTNPPDAPIAVAILKTFPLPDDLDKAARTFVGALMGFLPTVDGNLRLSLNEWLRDGTFWSLRVALRAAKGSPFDKAKRILDKPLREVMLLRPSPGMIWRRATRDHSLGAGKCPVHKGQTVALSIASATQQSLETAPHDSKAIYAIFGGDRKAEPHPTHACPGYNAAMGILLGTLSAFLEVEQDMRASNAPLAFTFEGEFHPPTP